MADDTAKEIGARLRDYRLKSGLTQKALADKSDIKPNTIARLERGLHRASTPTIEKLARALGVRASDILNY
jgi:transcriptional regulator with XRE-family HTH domain